MNKTLKTLLALTVIGTSTLFGCSSKSIELNDNTEVTYEYTGEPIEIRYDTFISNLSEFETVYLTYIDTESEEPILIEYQSTVPVELEDGSIYEVPVFELTEIGTYEYSFSNSMETQPIDFVNLDLENKVTINIVDTTAPEFSEFTKEIKIVQNATDIDLSNYFLATDLNEVTIEVDDSKVDYATLGTYDITVVAKDSYDNATEEKSSVVVIIDSESVEEVTEVVSQKSETGVIVEATQETKQVEVQKQVEVAATAPTTESSTSTSTTSGSTSTPSTSGGTTSTPSTSTPSTSTGGSSSSSSTTGGSSSTTGGSSSSTTGGSTSTPEPSTPAVSNPYVAYVDASTNMVGIEGFVSYDDTIAYYQSLFHGEYRPLSEIASSFGLSGEYSSYSYAPRDLGNGTWRLILTFRP